MRIYNSLIAGIMLIPALLTAQSVSGKLVDINGAGLSGLKVKVYSSPKYNTVTSSTDGSFYVANVTDIEDDHTPTGYYISNNYPNPFNPKTRINFNVPYKSNVKVDVFNIIGQNVGRGIDKTFEAGNNFFDLELKGLPNGVYLARINIAEKYLVTKKMMLVYGTQHLSPSANNYSLPQQNYSAGIAATSITIDSIVVNGTSIKQNSFTGLPKITGVNLDLGNLIINTTLTGVPCPGIPTITYAGKTYNTVKIGTQCWFKENLNVGTMIPGNQEQLDNSILEKYCFNDDPNNCITYGGLYQWMEAMAYGYTPGTMGICPTGWHLPTTTEFETLSSSVNNNGNALKSIGQGTGDGAGTNTSGFSSFLVGQRIWSGTFDGSTNIIFYWSSSEGGLSFSDIMYMYDNDNIINNNYYTKSYGLSIRCIKN